ncbi:MAG: hypothetical protein JWQ87_5241 [Candidatus Sulfotelmatobacter sp.]|nr:hypothetical protein [Candidatus Sulfotelmatobacter sp.]
MTYMKPELQGYSAISQIQSTMAKIEDVLDVGGKTDPAYEADE